MTSYEKIYSRFLGKIKTYDIPNMPTDIAYELMNEYLHSSFAIPHVRKLFSSLLTDDERMVVEFTLTRSIDEDSDERFVVDIISDGMALAWVTPRVLNVQIIDQMFGGKEEKFYSQSNHLSVLQGLKERLEKDIRKKAKHHSYLNNSYSSEGI